MKTKKALVCQLQELQQRNRLSQKETLNESHTDTQKIVFQLLKISSSCSIFRKKSSLTSNLLENSTKKILKNFLCAKSFPNATVQSHTLTQRLLWGFHQSSGVHRRENDLLQAASLAQMMPRLLLVQRVNVFAAIATMVRSHLSMSRWNWHRTLCSLTSFCRRDVRKPTEISCNARKL
jgi:hypothetical protein